MALGARPVVQPQGGGAAGAPSVRTVLLVEADREVAAHIRRALDGRGYRIWHAETGADAKALLEPGRADLIILGLRLPDVDGLLLCAELRARTAVPIILCGASSQKRDAILGLKLGADDFIAKPLDLDELEARVEAVLRRAGQSRPAEAPSVTPPESIRVDELIIDRSRHRVTLGSAAIPLTATEYRLLLALASRPDEILTRHELARRVWGSYHASSGRTIDVHIQRLRAKLASAPVPAPGIVGIRGKGYLLASDARAAALIGSAQAGRERLPGRLV